MYTLKEHHDHLLSVPFDASFTGNDAIDISSSQLDGGFGFDDNFFFGGDSDGLDLGGGIGDELARELGSGWGGSPMKTRNE
jgi:meiotic recombination protein REC8